MNATLVNCEFEALPPVPQPHHPSSRPRRARGRRALDCARVRPSSTDRGEPHDVAEEEEEQRHERVKHVVAAAVEHEHRAVLDEHRRCRRRISGGGGGPPQLAEARARARELRDHVSRLLGAAKDNGGRRRGGGRHH